MDVAVLTGDMMHELSQEMQYAVQNAVQSYSREILVENGRNIIEKYKKQLAENRRLATDEEVAAYAISRMPATYGAAHFALSECAQMLGLVHVSSHLDCGTGTGTVVLAANNLLSPDRIYAQEYDPKMISMGEKIMAYCNLHPAILIGDLCGMVLPHAELVTEGYVLGELTYEQRKKALLNMWNATQNLLLIVEPGTKEGFSIIREAKSLLLREGAHVIAPCVAECCPVTDEDWCHFAVRISRTQTHKYIKNGNAPFEDEKFCYVAFSRGPFINKSKNRILRHPIIRQGKIIMSLCSEKGKEKCIITKKDPLWKQARKSKWGETIKKHQKSKIIMPRKDGESGENIENVET